MKASSVRLTLTMWYVGAMIAVLGIFAACLLWFVREGASRARNNRLRGDVRWAVEMPEQRLGEGVLNGLLTARLGLAAIDVTRPLPFAALPPPKLSDLATDLLRKKDEEE